jgi:phosphonate transport system ATP-binding protein
MLRLAQLTKRFGPTVAVDNVTLDIPPGQMVGVIGRSGAGKSTLLRLINRLLEPTHGSVHFKGLNITALGGRELRIWRARCAMIFQQFNLVSRLDVLTNVLIGRLSYHWTVPSLLKCFSATERALAIRALERVDLLPQALQRADTLSGGQQQRVAIARALLQEPDIILADEPIASLDLRNANRVMAALRTINREDGLTIICNLHALATARTFCDRVIGMARGQVVFDGRPATLTTETLRQIYEMDEGGEDAYEPVASSGVQQSDGQGAELLPTGR